MGVSFCKRKPSEQCGSPAAAQPADEEQSVPKPLNETTSPENVERPDSPMADNCSKRSEAHSGEEQSTGSLQDSADPRASVQTSASKPVPCNQDTGHTVAMDTQPGPTSESEAGSLQSILDQCWREIESQCADSALAQRPGTAASSSGWRAVRLFVSSTFQDYHNEREILVKKVFPELREWCTTHHLHLIECDLRWGVPKDSTTGTVLSTCMQEIDRCHGDADGEGFFLNMLGERYGWVPTKDDVPSAIAEEYQWVQPTSVTHMEVLVGAYRTHNPNAVFFLRDHSGLADKIPSENQKQFEEPSEQGKLMLKELKSKLLRKFPDQTFSYSCEFESVQDSKVLLKGLESFGRQVLEFFQRAIERKFPDRVNIDTSPEQLEQDQHDIYMEQKGKLVYGRDGDIDQMMGFAKGEDSEAVAGKGRPHMVVAADPGEGKSSLMARFVMEAKKAGLSVFYHFVGCTSESNTPSSILKRLVERMEELFSDICGPVPGSEDEASKDTADEKNIRKLDKYTQCLVEAGSQLLIVVDAVNQSSRDHDRYRWIPKSLGGNLRCVMSTTREDRTLEELKELCPASAELMLTALDGDAREKIITNYFGRYNKTLDAEQLALLSHSDGAQNALWLSLACEELRVFGVFEKLTNRIREMPVTLEGLIESILERLITEDDVGLVEKTLHFLQCAPGGLTETELQHVLGDTDPGTPAPALHWAVVRRTLKPFLRNSGASGQMERLQFFHMALNKAIQKRLSADSELKKLRHRQLADYYQYHCKDKAVASQLAHQLSLAKEGQRLFDFFNKDERSAGINVVEKSRLLKVFRCTNMTKSDFPGCTKFGFCTFCENTRSKRGPNAAWPAKDCCVICGQRIPFKGPKCAKAYWCPFHKPAFPAFRGKFTCFVCQKSINQPRGDPPMALLCTFCDPGFMDQCCKLVLS